MSKHVLVLMLLCAMCAQSAGTKKNFFGGNIEVKETKMYVDTSATPMNRFKEAFGLK